MAARQIDRESPRGGAVALPILIAVVLAVVTCPGGAKAAEPPATDQAAWLFDSHRVVEIDLEVPQASIDVLEADPDEYREATLTLGAGGKTYGPMKVGLRRKGGSTLRTFAGKTAFKVKFNEFGGKKFEGLKRLTLNSMIQDRSMFHETLAYDVFRDFGVAAPRTGYAFVRVNGTGFGLYLSVETLDDVSLPRWFPTTQHLYEGSPHEDLDPGNQGAFEVDEGDDSDLADLEALIAAANGVAGDWSDGMDAVADLEQVTRMWAVERYVGHWDGYAGEDLPELDNPNNFYLHSDAAGVFSMLPWGTDQTWHIRIPFDEDGGLLFDRCLADASCNTLYVSALEELRPVVAGLELDRRAQEIAALLAPCQAIEDPVRREATAADLESSVISSREFIAARPRELADWLGVEPGVPAPEGAPAAGGEQPCPPLPKREPDVEAGSPPPPAMGRLWIGRTRVRGATVSTTLALPSPGRAGLRVDVVAGGRSAVACRASRNSNRAGLITLQCRLASWARRKLKRTRLRLKVTFSFAPAGAEPTFRIRHLTLPRRSPS